MGRSVTMLVPTFIRYDLDGELRIQRLQAFWELPAMGWQFVRNGVGAVPVGVQLSRALLRNQGLSGTVGFLAAVRGRRAASGTSPVCSTTPARATRSRSSGGWATPQLITRGDVDRIGTSELVALLHGAQWDGSIRAGNYVVAGRRARRTPVRRHRRDRDASDVERAEPAGPSEADRRSTRVRRRRADVRM